VGGARPEAERRRLLAVADYAPAAQDNRPGMAAAVRIVAHFLDVPICAVGLIDAEAVHISAAVGLDLSELPRSWGLTPAVLASAGTVAVADIAADRHFAHQPLGPGVGPVRAWLGTPLCTGDGVVIGAVFAADHLSREFSLDQLALVEGIGELVMTELDLRRTRHREPQPSVTTSVDQRFESLLRDASDTVAVLDVDGGLVYASPALCSLLGYENTVVNAARLVDRNDLPAMINAVTAAMARPGITGPVEFRIAHGDGSLRTFEAVFANSLDDPAVKGMVVYLRDITTRHRTAALLNGESRILEMMARGVPVTDVLHAVIELVEEQAPGARAVIRTFDRKRRSLKLAAAPNLPASFTAGIEDWHMDPADPPPVLANVPRHPIVYEDVAEATEIAPGLRAAAAAHRLVSAWVLPVVSAASKRLLGTVGVYLSERRVPDAEDEHLLQVAAGLVGLAVERHHLDTDDAEVPVGLVPRTELIRRLDQTLARAAAVGGKVAVLLLDLDRFKEVNEGVGHDGGDLVLPMVTRRLAQVVRPADLVARVAGDEFVVVCEGLVGELEAVGVAERINVALREPVQVDRSELRLTASIGIAMTHGDGDHAESVLRDADAALYQAKQRGRARFELFNEARRRDVQARRQLEGELERAIDEGELRVWLQPEIELPSGALLGFEALVRWEHPTRGLLSPVEFIPHAERSGLIDRLGQWVQAESCHMARQWRDDRGPDGDPMIFSVNLSVRQLADPLLPQRVQTALDDAGLAPEELCLELTESALMDDADLSLNALRSLKSIGVKLAIDDFGTGYSSLAYLRRFPIDAVKIDRSFVSGLGSRSEDGAIVTAVLGLTRALGLIAIAEGVEQGQQRDELVRLGCAAAQGYLFSPPRPADEVIRLP
jgi:diguanylate cyclase (GGDEF)-like protein/PAS domain S-box-containing protein